jgi:Trk-type K+ transport system membrane component
MVHVCGTLNPENDLTKFARISSWFLRSCIPKNSSWQAPLQYLLDHPRRCYIYLFPTMHTWILFAVVLILTYVGTAYTKLCTDDIPIDLSIGFASSSWISGTLSLRASRLAFVSQSVYFKHVPSVRLALPPSPLLALPPLSSM